MISPKIQKVKEVRRANVRGVREGRLLIYLSDEIIRGQVIYSFCPRCILGLAHVLYFVRYRYEE